MMEATVEGPAAQKLKAMVVPPPHTRLHRTCAPQSVYKKFLNPAADAGAIESSGTPARRLPNPNPLFGGRYDRMRQSPIARSGSRAVFLLMPHELTAPCPDADNKCVSVVGRVKE